MVISAAEYFARPAQPTPQPVLAPYIRTDGLTLLVGPEKGGKSTWLGAVATAVAEGVCPPWASSIRSGPVLWLTGEETSTTVMEGFKGASPAALARIFVEEVSGSDVDHVLALIRAKQPVLVIADPVDVLAPPRKEPRRTLEPLLTNIRTSKKYGVVAVVHTLHGARPGAKIIKGAGDWPRVARSIVWFGPDPRHDPDSPEKRALLYHYPANRGGEQGDAQEFGKDDGWLGTVRGLDLDHLFKRPETKPMPATTTSRAMRLLEEWLADGPKLASDMISRAERAGISPATTNRAATKLGVTRTSVRKGGRFEQHWWSLGAGPVCDESGPNSSDYDAATLTPVSVFPDPQDFMHLSSADQRVHLLKALGLPPDATADLVTRRCRELLLKHHPDHGGDCAVTARIIAIRQRLRELNDASGATAA